MTGPVALRVLCWNVRGLREDVEALVETVLTAQPQLVVVQEAPRIVRWRTRVAQLASRCGLVVVRGGPDASGNLLLASLAVEVQATRVVPLPLTRFQYPRAAVLLEGALAGHRFTAVGVHLGLTEQERVAHAPLLIAALPPDRPAILAGDFNETAAGPAWRLLAANLTSVGAEDPTPTFSTRSPRRRIDGLFLSPGLTARNYQVIDTPAVRRASDHFPVFAEVELEKPR